MIGYCVVPNPQLASFRLRVAIPSQYVGPHRFGVGDVTFFYKEGAPEIAKGLTGPIVYDVVNAHFHRDEYRVMCDLAHFITCPSEPMAEIIRLQTGRTAVVIPDPYENDESAPEVKGGRVTWFGHSVNLKSLVPYWDLPIHVCTGSHWSLENEAKAIESAAVVLLTAGNPGASSNRPVKALRAGRFVVAPEDSPESWNELSDFMWIGDVREGIRWALANREEACAKVKAGQQYIEKFSPLQVGSGWKDLFDSISAVDTNTNPAGSASISQ